MTLLVSFITTIIFWFASSLVTLLANGEQLQFPNCDEIFHETEPFALCTSSRIQQECGQYCKGQKSNNVRKSYSSKSASSSGSGRSRNIGGAALAAKVVPAKSSVVAATNEQCDGISPCISLQSANDKFHKCCKKRGVIERCLFLCDYTRSGDDLQDAVVDGVCPVTLLEPYLRCASNDQDNTRCCKETGILNPRRKNCPSFCHTALMQKWPKSLGQAVDYLPCVEVQDKILKCHWAGLRDEGSKASPSGRGALIAPAPTSSRGSGSYANANRAGSTEVKKLSNNGKCDGQTPCISLESANAKFAKCCKSRNVIDRCLFLCDYSKDGDDLQDAVVDGVCPVSLLENYLKCASNQQDNNDCCQKAGVLNPRRKICTSFCNPPSHKTWPKSLGQAVDYLPCVQLHQKILKCHWANLPD